MALSRPLRCKEIVDLDHAQPDLREQARIVNAAGDGRDDPCDLSVYKPRIICRLLPC
jgi:hypothetical protein